MPSPLDNLVATGKLHAEPAAQAEIDGLLRSGAVRIADAEKSSNSLESRFDLAYNAAHAFSLAALRHRGYRSDNRYPAALARIDPGLLVRSDPSAARMPVSDPAGRCAKEAPVLDLSPLVPA